MTVTMSDGDPFTNGLIDHLPHLLAFAQMMTRDRVSAEDLVQDSILLALANRRQFRPESNLRAWLTVILRNRFFNEMRRSHRRLEIGMEAAGWAEAIEGGQEERVVFGEFQRAFGQLPPEQREALALVAASGFSYPEAAAIAGCPTGTVKSRVFRAREVLQLALDDSRPPGKDKPSPAWRERAVSEANRVRVGAPA
jgi:RNA polymerase sigma-70 factor (ECF subfamily)